jgi:hypothetical protein
MLRRKGGCGGGQTCRNPQTNEFRAESDPRAPEEARTAIGSAARNRRRRCGVIKRRAIQLNLPERPFKFLIVGLNLRTTTRCLHGACRNRIPRRKRKRISFILELELRVQANCSLVALTEWDFESNLQVWRSSQNVAAFSVSTETERRDGTRELF